MERNKLDHDKGYSSLAPKSKKKISIYIGLILILIILIGYFFVHKKNNQIETIETIENPKEIEINKLFSVSEYNAIPDKYKEHIYDFMQYNGYLGGEYFLTKISDRAKNVFAFGDFTSDDNDEDDMAIIIEKNDFSSSKLIVFNHKGELLYVENYSNELPIINSYKVGSKIYMDELKLVPSPCDGLIVKMQYNKRAVVYDKKDKKFKTYYQYTKEEIDALNKEEDYDEGYEDYEETPPKPDSTTQVDEFKIQEVK